MSCVEYTKYLSLVQASWAANGVSIGMRDNRSQQSCQKSWYPLALPPTKRHVLYITYCITYFIYMLKKRRESRSLSARTYLSIRFYLWLMRCWLLFLLCPVVIFLLFPRRMCARIVLCTFYLWNASNILHVFLLLVE